MSWAEPLAWIVGAYLVGSVSSGVLLVGWLEGGDPRRRGSGNAGATNVLRTVGPGAALLTLGLDVAKGVVPVLLARHLGVREAVVAGVAVAAVAGHIFPLFFGFRGGKGVATALGAYLGLAPGPVLASLAVFVAAVAWSRYVSLGSVLAVVLYPLALWAWGGLAGAAGGGGRPGPWPLLAAVLVAVVVVVAHRDNLRRLRAGTERRLGGSRPGGAGAGGGEEAGMNGANSGRAARETTDRGWSEANGREERMSDGSSGETQGAEGTAEGTGTGRDPAAPIGVLGAGSFGTALAVHWAEHGHRVRLWARREELARELGEEGTNREYLPEVGIPGGVEATSRLELLGECDPVVVAVPSHGFRQVLKELLEVWPGDRRLVVVSATKGIEPGSLARMSRVTAEEAESAGSEVAFAVLSGPSFAAELARGAATAAVIASEDEGLARALRQRLASPTLRLYSSTDVVGVELGGTVKNVIAIAAGVVAGLKLGHNTLAALITRGLHEITRLGLAYGGEPRTFAGLAGLGDLVVTCTGALSRNRSLGVALAEGKSREEATAGSHMVVEGVRNSLAISQLAEKKGVSMPIVEQMVEILYRDKPPSLALQELMTRELKSEAEL